MARIKIEMPEKWLYKTEIGVRITDLNYGNHAGNDAIVSILHEARVRFLKAGGFSELWVGGPGLIMADLTVEYIRELFYGDILTISISSADISRLSFDLFYEIKATRDQLEFIAAKAKTGMVCYDYQAKRVAAIPDVFKTFLLSEGA